MNKLGNFLLGLWADESGGAGGRLGLGILGAGIGFLIGGPLGAAAFGAQLGFLAGSLVGNILWPQTLPDLVGSRLDPNKTMISAYGAPISIGFGQFVVGANVAYYPGFVEHEIVEEVGGKGGGPTQTVRSYTYTGSFRANLCEGPAAEIVKIWANRILIYDATNTTDPQIDFDRINRAPGVNAIRHYLGTETQEPDPTEQADKGLDATPAYRGIVGLFFQNYPLDDSGGVPPQVTALISMKSTEHTPKTTLAGAGSGVYYEWTPGKRALISSGHAKISVESQTLLRTSAPVDGNPQFPCVDGNGDFYRISDGEGVFSPQVFKISGETLQTLASGTDVRNPIDNSNPVGPGFFWFNARVFGGVRAPDGEMRGELLFAQRRQLAGNIAGAIIISVDSIVGDFGGCIKSYAPKIAIQSLAVDSERFLWFLVDADGSGTDVELNRLSPVSGETVETYTLAGRAFDRMAYDPVTNSLILGLGGAAGTAKLARWGLDSHAIDDEFVSIAFDTTEQRNLTAFWNGPTTDGRMYLEITSSWHTFQEFNIHSMTAGRSWDPVTDYGLVFDRTRLGLYDESRDAVISDEFTGGDLYWLYLHRQVADSIQVKDIVEAVALRVGFAASQFDVANLTQALHGYLLERRVPGNTAIDPLRRFFLFNPVSEDFKVQFPLLGGTPVATIPEDDLAAGDDGSIRVEVDKLAEEIINEIELPEVLEMESAGEKRDYQPQVQRAKLPRTTTNSRRKRFLSFPGTFITDADAAQRLEQLLNQIIAKRRPVTIRTSQKWLRLSPADVVKVQSEGLEHQIILGQMDIGVNNVIEMKGSSDDPSTLISLATGLGGDIPEQTIGITSPSEFFIMDISLRDQDDFFGVYVAGAPFNNNSGWRGEEVLRSADGNDYGAFAFIPGSRAVDHGFATTVLPDADADVWDRDSTLSVTMLRGTLPSSTEALVLDGANPLLIGKEVVCYVTSVDNGGGNFTVSTLLRGRRGTEGETGLHAAEEKVVVLSEDTLVRKAMDLSNQDTAFFYKGVTIGGSLDAALRKAVTVQGKSVWTWSPVHVKGSITADDWTINWTWRSRVNGRWRDLQGLVHPTVLFDYEVDVLDGPEGTVLATYTTATTANGSVVNAGGHWFFYDAADQAVDFGSAQTTVTFKVYPVSPGVGRGFPTEATLVGG